MAAVSEEREQQIINNLLKSCQSVLGPCLFLHTACPLVNAAFRGDVISASGVLLLTPIKLLQQVTPPLGKDKAPQKEGVCSPFKLSLLLFSFS